MSKLKLTYLAPVAQSGVFNLFYEKHEQEINDFISESCDVNPLTYEGGIRCWFGPGSVMLYELGVELTVDYKRDSTSITLHKEAR